MQSDGDDDPGPGEPDAVRLYEYEMDEWWYICRAIAPAVTREEFDAQWREFLRWRAVTRAN